MGPLSRKARLLIDFPIPDLATATFGFEQARPTALPRAQG